jgi:hypothetical protein
MPPPSVALPRAVEARFGTGHWHWMLARRLAQEPAQPRSRCPSGRLRVDVFGPQPASPSPPGLGTCPLCSPPGSNSPATWERRGRWASRCRKRSSDRRRADQIAVPDTVAVAMRVIQPPAICPLSTRFVGVFLGAARSFRVSFCDFGKLIAQTVRAWP